MLSQTCLNSIALRRQDFGMNTGKLRGVMNVNREADSECL